MAYLVLARKYRPTLFADLVGQEHIVRTLDNAIALDRVHHAFLFTGARGVGKTTTARVFARALNCAQGPTTTPCGTCGPCREILAGSAPDVLEIDGASHTGVDHVRELLESVRYLPASARYKIYVIDEVHMLSTAAFNALLKTLEEPPAHVKFLFATTEPHKIPITILSRCQRFDFRKVGVVKLVAHLRRILEQEKVALGGAALTAVARQAEGSVRDALSLLDQVLSYGGSAPDDAQVLEALGVVDRQMVFALCDALLQRDAAAMLGVIAEVDARGHDLSDLAAHLAEHMRDVAVIQCVSDPAQACPERSGGEIDALKAQATQRSQGDWQQIFRHVLQVAQDVARSNMPRISLEMGLLRLFEMTPGVDLATLVERLDTLLGKGPAVGPSPPQSPPKPPSGSEAAQNLVGQAVPFPTPEQAGMSPPPPPPSALKPPPPIGRPAAAAPTAVAEPEAGDATGGHHAGWSRFVDKVRSERPALASVLEHGRLMAFEPGRVEVAYEPGTFYWDAARDPDNAALAAEWLTEHLDTATRFVVVAAPADAEGAPSLAEVSEKRRESFDRTVQQSAREHVAVARAVSILQGELTEVRQLAQEPTASMQE